jgi:tetratricopeptide (TPR) repeat protein
MDNYAEALNRVRKGLRLADYANVEAMLEKAAQFRNQDTAEYFNLLGVLYEAQHKWRLARKCYARAVAADKRFEPAQANMRRLFELRTYGRTHQAVMLGDESDDIWSFRLPEGQS